MKQVEMIPYLTNLPIFFQILEFKFEIEYSKFIFCGKLIIYLCKTNCMLVYNTNWSSIFVLAPDSVFIVFYFIFNFIPGIQIATFWHVRIRDVNIGWIWFNTKQLFRGSPAFLSYSPMWNMNIQIIFDYFFLTAQGVYLTNTKAI